MAQPHPILLNARDVEGEAERNALRMARQNAIRHGRYLPPLPHLPIQPVPPGIVIQEVRDRALGFQLDQRRQFLLENIRPARFPQPGFFNPRPEDNYRPLSPSHSDEESDEEEGIIAMQQQIRRDWRAYMNQRVEPIPQEMVDRLLQEHDQWANAMRGNNNNDNFRNFNGMLSPSPSLSPAPSPAPSEEMDPLDQAREDDEDIEMLNVQFLDMRPNVPRPRKRQSSDDEAPTKRKRVTFAEDSVEEAIEVFEPTADCNDNVQFHRRQFDDDDEGFFGGPSSSSSHSSGVFCA